MTAASWHLLTMGGLKGLSFFFIIIIAVLNTNEQLEKLKILDLKLTKPAGMWLTIA